MVHLGHNLKQWAAPLSIMKRIVRVTIWTVVTIAALYTSLAITDGVSFYRPVPLANEPLTNAVAVTSIFSNKLTLADGRVLVMEGFPPEILTQQMRDSGGRVQLEPIDPRFIKVIVKKKRFICGTHGPAVVIPLLRHEYPAYESYLLGLGTLQ